MLPVSLSLYNPYPTILAQWSKDLYSVSILCRNRARLPFLRKIRQRPYRGANSRPRDCKSDALPITPQTPLSEILYYDIYILSFKYFIIKIKNKQNNSSKIVSCNPPSFTQIIFSKTICRLYLKHGTFKIKENDYDVHVA